MLSYRKISRLICSLSIILIGFIITGCIDLASNEARNKHVINHNSTVHSRGEVYTMRGGLGGVFSIGMNRLEDTFKNKYHLQPDSTVWYNTVWYKSNSLSNTIIKRYKAKEITGPIILVGHSLGANDQIKVARNLARENIPVAFLLTVDAVSPLPVPPNVAEVFNIYKPSYIPLSGGYKLKAMDPTSTHIENFHVTTMKGVYVNHWTITMHRKIQKIMAEKIFAALKGEQKTHA